MRLSERFGTRHRAALGITEDTDAVAVVVSEENGQMSVVERARIVRVPTEAQLERSLAALLETPDVRGLGLGGRVAPVSPRRAVARLRIARRRAARSAPAAGAATPRPEPRPTARPRPPTSPASARGAGAVSASQDRAPRLVGAVVHNWPLKLARDRPGHARSTSASSRPRTAPRSPGPIPVAAVSQPSGTVVTNQLRPIDEVRYIAPADLGRLTGRRLPGHAWTWPTCSRRAPRPASASWSRPWTRG